MTSRSLKVSRRAFKWATRFAACTVGAIIGLFAGAQWVARHNPKFKPHEILSYYYGELAVFVGIFAFVVIVFQIVFVTLQMEQAEELAERKDEALITAITELTNELRRRPAPNPAEIHLSLFGAKK